MNININDSKSLVKYFNTLTGRHFRFGNEEKAKSNISLSKRLLEKVGDVQVAKDLIRDRVAINSTESFAECVTYLYGRIDAGVRETKSETPVNPQKKREPKKPEGIQHERFETVLKFVQADEPVYLTGPAGSGKNVLCKQVADAMGLDFYFTNAVTQEYKLTGFVDAMGRYQETQFYKAFTQGGLFMLDEMDASIPEVLVILNAAIANRYFDFPGVGYVEAHPDFRIIAAGNTVGTGADGQYTGRNQLDAASLDRFAVVKIDYDNRVEEKVAGDEELAEFCRSYRKACQNAGLQTVVSYRAIGRLAKMLKVLDTKEALETCLVKGLEADDIRAILNDLPAGKYRDAMMKVVRGF